MKKINLETKERITKSAEDFISQELPVFLNGDIDHSRIIKRRVFINQDGFQAQIEIKAEYKPL